MSLCTFQRHRIHLKLNTQRCFGGKLPRRISSTSPRHIIGISWRCLKRTLQRSPISTFHNVSSSYQMKHPTTSQWFVIKMSLWYVSTTSYSYVSTTSPVSPKWNTQQRRCGTSPPRLKVTLLRRLVSSSLLRLEVILSYFLVPTRRERRRVV